jgi:hypothetical protein
MSEVEGDGVVEEPAVRQQRQNSCSDSRLGCPKSDATPQS